MVSNKCQSSLKLYLVSKPDIFLEQTNYWHYCSRRAGKSLRLGDNTDLLAGSKDKLAYLTSRLTYQHIDFARKYQDSQEHGHDYHQERRGYTAHTIRVDGKMLDEMNNLLSTYWLQLNETVTTYYILCCSRNV